MKVEQLFERTMKSQPAEVVSKLIRKLAFKHMLLPKWYKMSDERNVMSFEEWQEHKFKREFGLVAKTSDPQRVSVFTDALITLGEELRKVYRHDDTDNQRRDMKKWMNALLKPFGWFVFRVDGSTYMDPIKQESISVPAKLYHFSLVWNKDSILRKGLIPKRGQYDDDFMYPPRVHVLTKYHEDSLRDLALHIMNHGRDIEDVYHQGLDKPPLAIFEIDTAELNKGTKFYIDASVDDGVWTYTHIPASALKLIHEDEFTDE